MCDEYLCLYCVSKKMLSLGPKFEYKINKNYCLNNNLKTDRVILYNYINEIGSWEFSTHVRYPPQEPNHRTSTQSTYTTSAPKLSKYKIFKMINLTHMIFILNSVFTIVFYMRRWRKQDPLAYVLKK
jgi:hypothetical protein